uniref:Uncharacterized protein n=1 Tax=Tetraselmis sp. GSL018 TaxID=582737 RepID=A0A061RSV5_9CHLO|eukprot:CAMPEP_0177621558 /NCGR_PEP_ID=MMETSP0419_2-20121207/27650_1 /TAXON_ID=582737 /ORGANISM="Tetraselmis sp., Strain GSL018" /LENGTH=183 /DNA_ID=CAMNT_0019121485 /DNA_START=505 /DNA_END=1056 /DNA_ORIENTATION=-
MRGKQGPPENSPAGKEAVAPPAALLTNAPPGTTRGCAEQQRALACPLSPFLARGTRWADHVRPTRAAASPRRSRPSKEAIGCHEAEEQRADQQRHPGRQLQVLAESVPVLRYLPLAVRLGEGGAEHPQVVIAVKAVPPRAPAPLRLGRRAPALAFWLGIEAPSIAPRSARQTLGNNNNSTSYA